MTMRLRPLREAELLRASELCLRSKGYWGYDQDFLAKCVQLLEITASDLKDDHLVITPYASAKLFNTSLVLERQGGA